MSSTDPNLLKKIAEQEDILDQGVRRVTVDGVSTEFDLDRLERRASRNRATRDGTTKRTLTGIRLDG